MKYSSFVAVGIRNLVLWACGAGLSVMSCATLPTTGTARTGAPLSVRSNTEVYSYTVKEKVGEVEYKDSSGRTVATADEYRNVAKHESYEVWKTYQGNSVIDEQDFYDIAGKKETAARIQAEREAALKMNRTGWIVTGSGLGAALIGTIITSVAVTSATSFDSTGQPKSDMSWALPVGYGLTIGGGLAAAGGYLVHYLTASKLSPAYHWEPQEEATRVAEEYNATLTSKSSAPAPSSPPSYLLPQSKKKK